MKITAIVERGRHEITKRRRLITIQSYKHDGRLHRTWRDTMVLKTTENAVIGVKRSYPRY